MRVALRLREGGPERRPPIVVAEQQPHRHPQCGQDAAQPLIEAASPASVRSPVTTQRSASAWRLLIEAMQALSRLSGSNPMTRPPGGQRWRSVRWMILRMAPPGGDGSGIGQLVRIMSVAATSWASPSSGVTEPRMIADRIAFCSSQMPTLLLPG